MGVVEGDATFLKVQAHAQPGRQWVRVARGRGRAVVVVGDVSVVVVVVVVVVAVLGQIDFPHAHGEETEGWSRVQGVLRSTVMAAVWVVAEEKTFFIIISNKESQSAVFELVIR